MKRKIPVTMATQHPDHINTPYWHTEAFINTSYEYKECYLAYSDLDIDECKWDWEGKLVDESVMEHLIGEYYDYFKENQLGKKKFLTFRFPNPKTATDFRLIRAFAGLLSTTNLAKSVGLYCPAIFEAVLPMVESADELIAVKDAFIEMNNLEHTLYKLNYKLSASIELIPLFEEVNIIVNSDKILEEYIMMHEKKYGFRPTYLRPYIARSDPALNAGLVPSVLSTKIALSRYKKLARKLGVALYPMLGVGSLPFRGGLTPYNIHEFVNEYRGVRTVTIQSSFRYDHEKDQVKKAITELQTEIPRGSARSITPADETRLLTMCTYFESAYRNTIMSMSPLINDIAMYVPKRRERVKHNGILGYSRQLGTASLPRAITFTAAFYSIGIPPELIGTGRGIETAVRNKDDVLLEKYVHLQSDLQKAGRFLNKENVKKVSTVYPLAKGILKDIEVIEGYFGITLSPTDPAGLEHLALTGKIYEKLGKDDESISELIEQAAKLRKVLG